MNQDTRLVALDDIRDIPMPTDVEETKPHSWQPENLIQLAENPPAPPTIGGLLYPAKRTVLSGETESMKTWLALILCKAELDIGLTVGWVDLDAMGPGALLERLQLLGVDDETIGNDFLYYQPSQRLDTAMLSEIEATIAARSIRLFIIDAFNPMLFLQDLDPNSNPDIEEFWQVYADPIARAGAAPVLLDHVVKNAENRGKYSTGSERKASGAIVHLGFRLLEPLKKGGKGKTLLTVHKDRPGYLPRPHIGRLVITAEGDQITYEIEPDKGMAPDGTHRHTIYMERVSHALEMTNEPAAKKWIEENTPGKGEHVRAGLAELIEDGFVTAQKGERGAILHTLIRPYREAEVSIPFSSSPPRPDLVPNLVSVPSPDLVPSPPLRGRGRGQRDRPPTTSSQPRPRPNGEPIPEYEFLPIDESTAPEPEDPDEAFA